MRDLRIWHEPYKMDIISLKSQEIKKYVLRISRFYRYSRYGNSMLLEEENIKRTLAHQVAEQLVKEGFIKFEKGYDNSTHTDTIEARLNIFNYNKFQEDFEPECLI